MLDCWNWTDAQSHHAGIALTVPVRRPPPLPLSCSDRGSTLDVWVIGLQLDTANEAEAVRHGVSEREIEQVFHNEPVYLPNKRGHTAGILMVGRTFGGRLLTVPLSETARPGFYRPATAFDSSPGDAARYRQAGGV